MYDITPVTSPTRFNCGPASLKMLMSYYGIDADLEELTKECNVGRAGCTLKDLVIAARSRGLDPHSYKMDAEEVIRQDRPSMVWWKYWHFCVCCGMDEKGQVVICNPDRSRYRMSPELFKAFYSGIACFIGEPEDLPEAPHSGGVTITDEEAEEYSTLKEIGEKLMEVF